MFRKTFALELFLYPTSKCEAQDDLAELENLIQSAGLFLGGSELYQLRTIDSHSCVGSGKLNQLKPLFRARNINLIIIDFEIKPYALKNIENFFNIEVWDRSRLILEIFKQRATSAEGKLQVELAECMYELGRLVGKGLGKELSRLGGGIGTRGPGEQKMEKIRRSYQRKIKIVRKKLAQVEKTRAQHYLYRKNQGLPLISLVGYTNAGKSTLLNVLVRETIQASNQLFTTLDPTTRKIHILDKDFLLTDTVGFIKKLPTELIEGFESTLEQVALSDLILVVVDRSDKNYLAKEQEVLKILSKLHVTVPLLKVYNKIDLVQNSYINFPHTVYISCTQQKNLETLKSEIYKNFKK